MKIAPMTRLRLSDTMRRLLREMRAHPDAELVNEYLGWALRVRRALKPGERDDGWPRYEWLAQPTAPTVAALAMRGLLALKYPRTSPDVHVTTAVLTDAGKAALEALDA